MRVGIPREIKPLEGRVALIPDAAGELVRHGHTVILQSGAGVASGYEDADYVRAGVTLGADAAAVYGQAQLVLKVKEPIAPEFPLLHSDHLLFSFLHLAAAPALARVLCEKGLTAIAFETVEQAGRLPLLAPMSDIAGRIAVQVGATLLHRTQGGRGLLLGGLPGAPRGKVVVLGAGEAGGNAAALAAALGAEVLVFDRAREAMARMHALGPNVTALSAYRGAIAESLREADLLIGAVLIAGARAPRLVTTDMVRQMRPGSVVVDISVDQGGCIETTHPTDYTQPTYVAEGVTHFAVTNMPGAVPRTASQALSAVLLPYVLRLAEAGWDADPALRAGINVRDGKVVHPQVADALNHGE
jgi:alanine dehydrogenase